LESSGVLVSGGTVPVFTVVPHVGIGPLRLGITPAGVRLAVPGHEVRASLRGGNEEFIPELGFLVDYSAGFAEVVFAGCSGFDTKADSFVTAAVREYDLDPADFPPGQYDYRFPALNPSPWRGLVSDSPDERGWAFEAISVHEQGYFTSGG
jgi:hypothetical protein